MTWTRLSDNFTDRPELLEISRSARMLHVEALIWCNRLLRNGRITASVLRRISDSETLDEDVCALMSVGLWEHTDDGAYQVDWSDQEAAEDVLARQERQKATQRRYRRRKELHAAGDHSMCDDRYCKDTVSSNGDGNESNNETLSRPVRPVPLQGTGDEQHPYAEDGYGSCLRCNLPVENEGQHGGFVNAQL